MKSSSDLAKIEDMLAQLLGEVEDKKESARLGEVAMRKLRMRTCRRHPVSHLI
jgi:hypothetical protein